jgi:hypothetical protein
MTTPAQLDRVFHVIMRSLVDTGRALHYAEIARTIGGSVAEGRQILLEVMQDLPDRVAPSREGLHRVVPVAQQPADAVSGDGARRAEVVRAVRVRGGASSGPRSDRQGRPVPAGDRIGRVRSGGP